MKIRPDAELATNIETFVCDNCDALHINFLDESGMIFATGIMEPSEALKMGARVIEDANTLLARIEVKH